MTHRKYEPRPNEFSLHDILNAVQSDDPIEIQDVRSYLKIVEKDRPKEFAKLSVDLQTFKGIMEIAYLKTMKSEAERELKKLKKQQASESCKCVIS